MRRHRAGKGRRHHARVRRPHKPKHPKHARKAAVKRLHPHARNVVRAKRPSKAHAGRGVRKVVIHTIVPG